MITLTSILTICTEVRQWEDRGDFEAAWTLIQGYLENVEDLHPLLQAHVLLRAGTLAARTGKVEQGLSKDWLSRSLDLFDKAGDNVQASAAAFGLALHCKVGGALNEAYIWLDLAIEKGARANTELLCRVELLRGIVKEDEGKFGEALEIYLAVAPLFDALDNYSLKAKFHCELANVRSQLAIVNYEQSDLALIEYEAASYNYEQAGNYRSSATVKNNLAFLLLKLGRPDEALIKINDAIACYCNLRDRPNQAQARETKAQILIALDRYEEAETEARISCDLLRIGGERALFVESLITHGRCFARLGKKLKAFRAFQLAQEVAEYIEFGHGLGLISLAILEEINDLDIDSRRLHHKVVVEKLNSASDARLRERHAACVRTTVELFTSEMGLEELEGSPFQEGFSLDAAVLAFERLLIERALEEASGCQKEAARLLGISASNLNHKLKHQHKPAKVLQTYGHYRGAKILSHIDTQTMPNDALSGLGIYEGDELVLKSGCRVGVGDPVILRSRRKLFIGIYEQEPGKILLCPVNDDYDTWEFKEGTFEVAFKVVGFIPKDEVGKPGARVRELVSDSSAARLPAS